MNKLQLHDASLRQKSVHLLGNVYTLVVSNATNDACQSNKCLFHNKRKKKRNLGRFTRSSRPANRYYGVSAVGDV